MGLVLLGLLSGDASVAAQEGREEGVYFSRRRVFLIPFNPDGDRRIREVRLHVSRNEGSTYERVASASANERQFRFEASEDGWYWFSVQTVDDRGQTFPPDLTRLAPGLKVYVDTRPPQVFLRGVPPTTGTAAIEWDIRDNYPDLLSLRVDYRIAGARNWVPLGIPQVARGRHDWDPGRAGQVEVRLQVEDRAGNTAEGTTTLSASADKSDKPPAHTPGGKVLYVNSLTFHLNYSIKNVGASGVDHVEIWYTRDGNKYERYPGNASPSGRHMVQVEREGRYGFSLVPVSGVGLAPPAPSPGSEPQIWVQVDETPPEVSVRQVVVGRGPDRGKLTIYWRATDSFLKSQPVSITYADTPEGEWKDLITNVPNTGSYTCNSQGLPFQFYIRVEAVDEAGNQGTHIYPEKVKVDLKVPQIDRVGISVGAAPGP
jgi:hypothetical protein